MLWNSPSIIPWHAVCHLSSPGIFRRCSSSKCLHSDKRYGSPREIVHWHNLTKLLGMYFQSAFYRFFCFSFYPPPPPSLSLSSFPSSSSSSSFSLFLFLFRGGEGVIWLGYKLHECTRASQSKNKFVQRHFSLTYPPQNRHINSNVSIPIPTIWINAVDEKVQTLEQLCKKELMKKAYAWCYSEICSRL